MPDISASLAIPVWQLGLGITVALVLLFAAFRIGEMKGERDTLQNEIDALRDEVRRRPMGGTNAGR